MLLVWQEEETLVASATAHSKRKKQKFQFFESETGLLLSDRNGGGGQTENFVSSALQASPPRLSPLIVWDCLTPPTPFSSPTIYTLVGGGGRGKRKIVRSQSANGEEEGKLFASLIPGIFLSRVSFYAGSFPGEISALCLLQLLLLLLCRNTWTVFSPFFPRRHQHPDGTRMRFFDYSRRLKKHLGKEKGEISLVHFFTPFSTFAKFCEMPPLPRRNSSCIFERRATEKRCKYAPR